MRRFVPVVIMLCSVPALGVAVAQSPFGGQSTEMNSSSQVSSNSAMMAVMRAPVTGQPYVAQKVTRSVWTLADGTIITHESDTNIARDSAGRVREEIENTQASSVGGKQIDRTSESITIADPVDHTLTVLSPPPAKMAMRMQMPNLAGLPKSLGSHGMTGIIEVSPPPPPPPGSISPGVRLGSTDPAAAARLAKLRAEMGEGDEVKTEDLGSDAIDGLHVTGKRTTTTIPMGKIGNDRPIVITHEEWYSPDLKLVVKSVDNDPRTGERTMELEGLSREDPDPALFKVPAGYKVMDMADMMKSLGSVGHTGTDAAPVR